MTTSTSDLKALPESSVPAAFDRGHLYSPTLDLTQHALDDRYDYDYRPGDLYEPMPPAPRGDGKAFAFWARNTAGMTVPDFLGLRVGDEVTIQHVTGTGPGKVIETQRRGAVVRYPMPEGASRPYVEMYVRRRNDSGHWYP
ncbi:hypothetical protein [Streptomyces sp. NPDC005407]|uniref:hypothetical protein n=1 Tax=Streptomyces sp. NPDC005407 TaxID=3155340 RepID=UPI0033B3FA85